MNLRQSTTATRLVGPVLDSAGAIYSSAVIGDFNITKNGTTAAMASTATATHSHNGYYLIAFTTGNTDTVGSIEISCNKATYTMPVSRWDVLAGAVYDVLYGTTAPSTNTAAANATAVRSELATELARINATISSRSTYDGTDTSGTTSILTAMELDGSVYRFTTNALEQAPIGAVAYSPTPVSGSATVGNVLEGAKIKGQYGAPLVGVTITCTTTNAGVTTARSLVAYDGLLAFVVFDNTDAMTISSRIVRGSNITVASNVATLVGGTQILNTVVGADLRWELREDTVAPSIVFAKGAYACERAAISGGV